MPRETGQHHFLPKNITVPHFFLHFIIFHPICHANSTFLLFFASYFLNDAYDIHTFFSMIATYSFFPFQLQPNASYHLNNRKTTRKQNERKNKHIFLVYCFFFCARSSIFHYIIVSRPVSQCLPWVFVPLSSLSVYKTVSFFCQTRK